MHFVTINFDFDRKHEHITNALCPVPAEKYDPNLAIMSHLDCEFPVFKHEFIKTNAVSVRNEMIKIAEEFNSISKYGKKRAEALLEYVLYNIIEDNSLRKSSAFEQLKSWLSTNYLTYHSISDPAEALNYHPNYLNKIFKEGCDMTIHKYVILLRLNHGADLLLIYR